MRPSPERLARASSRHPWRTIALWVVAITAMGLASSRWLSGVLTQDIAFTNRPESVRAQEVLDREFGTGTDVESTEFVIVSSARLTVDAPAFRRQVEEVRARVASLGPSVLAGPPLTYYEALRRFPDQAAALVSRDRRATLVPVALKDAGTSTIAALRSVGARTQRGGFRVQVAGPATLGADFTAIAEQDLRKGETIGIGIALVVLVVVFAALVAAVLPIVLALFAIAVALGLVALIGQVAEFNLFVTNMVTMIGLAVGIDYSLFIVSRYREQRRRGFDRLEAIGAAGVTANRAVLASGLTVVLALLGMLIIPTTIFRSLAAGAILVTLASLAASMTLLPALLALLGDKVNWPRLSRRARQAGEVPAGRFWDGLTRRVMARPVVFLLAGVLALGALGSFYFQLHRGTSQNISGLSADFPSKRAFLTLKREFAGGVTDPARIVVTGEVGSPAARAAVGRLRQAIARTEVFASQTQVVPARDGRAVEVDAYFRGDPSTDAAFQGIRDLRSTVIPRAFGGVPGVQVLVGGNTAFFNDFLDVADRYQWVVLAFVLGLSFILLTVVFRSVVVPATAIVMNVLSVAAAYGAVTLVFQKGVGIGVFNAIGFQFQRTEAIEAWLPLFLFSVLFGLSMDYHVFLLSRIREEFDRIGDNTEAVAHGLRRTAGIITGAALIMVAVFTGFAAGRLGPLQQMGFGLAVAVFMDATIVRTLLVPSTMRLLGDRNWYLPGWLRWLPTVRVEGHEGPGRPAEPRVPVGAGLRPLTRPGPPA